MATVSHEIASRKASDSWGSYGIDLLVGEPERMFCVWQGSGHHAGSARVSARELLESWLEHLHLSGAAWLFPLLVRIVSGEDIGTDAILDEYEARHGRPAPRQGG